MMLDGRNDLPLYRQLSQLMRQKILSGEWKPDEKIPTEPELCKEYGISRMTVRLALDELRKDSFIYRRQGLGTFVSLPKIDLNLSSSYSFTEEVEGMGHTIRKDILLWSEELAGKFLAEKLQISPSDKIFKIQRVLYCNENPYAVETSHIPVRLCGDLSKSEVQKNGLYRSLEFYSIRPNSASEMFEATMLDQKHQKLLKTSQVAGFLIHRLSFHDSLAVEYCEGYVNGERVRYNIALH